MSDSYSNAQNGSELVYDPTGGGLFEPSISQSSFASRYVYSTESGGMTLGSGGTISGGNDSFSFNQSNSDSHTLIAGTSSYNVYETFTDTYTLSMLGTETDGPGGNVSGGADSYTWNQTESDDLTIFQYDDLVNTLGTYSNDNVSLNDLLVADFSDVGTDILGTSDSILGGCDTYTSEMTREVNTGIVESGNAGGSPYLVNAFGWDQVNTGDSGSSTLTTNNHLYATDSFGYVEDSGGTATTTQTLGNSIDGWMLLGTAYDYYIDNDNGPMTISDSVTTSEDSFTVSSTHSITGFWSSDTDTSTGATDFYDNGDDEDTFAAYGVSGSSADLYTYTDDEHTGDDFVLTKQVYGEYNGVATDFTDTSLSVFGNTSTGPSGSSLSYSESSYFTDYLIEYGSTTEGTIVAPYSESTGNEVIYRFTVTGPPLTTVYQQSFSSETVSGATPPNPVAYPELVNAGRGYAAGSDPEGSRRTGMTTAV
jgi:hypothetical protein